MNAELTTIIGQISINDGEWRTDAPNQVAVREPKSANAPGAGKGDLFIVAEIQGNADNLDALEQKLAQTIRDSYYLARGSITASLRRAVQTGSDLLYNRNKKVQVEERVVGGVVALAISGEDAFVAQVGPTALFAIMGDNIQRYPQRSVWLDEALGPEPDDITSGLGLHKVIEPGIHHLRVVAEDILVLADARLAGQLPLKAVVRAVSPGDVKLSVKNLAEAAQTRQGSALVLEVIEQAGSGRGPIKVTPPAALGKLWPKPKATEPKPEPVAEPAEIEEESAVGAVFASTAAVMQRPLGWLGNIGGRGQTPEPPELPPAQKINTEEWFGPDDTPSKKPHPVEQFPSESEPAYTRYHDDDDEWETSSPRRPGIFSRLGVLFLSMLAAIGGGVRRLLGLFGIGADDDHPRQAGMQARASSSGFPWKTLRIAAIIIPLLVVIIVGVSYIQKGRLREAEYQEYVTSAQTKFDQAKAVDAQAARALMAESEAFLVQAEQIKPNQPEITELRQQMAAYVDTVGKVQRMVYLPQLRRYTDPGTRLHNIVVQGVEVYVLDTGNDRIYHHRLDDPGDALLPDDETVLMTAKGMQADKIAVGDLLGMTWMPTGGNRQTSDLVILNSTGLLEYNSNWGLATSMLAGGETLKAPAAVASYFGNFYILDPQANVLLRYLPTADGYSATPQNYFTADQPVNLANAVDLAIDGAVYVLFKDGQIKKYLSGQQTEFNVTGLDMPLNNPTAIFTLPDEDVQHIYVADAGNQRVVQLTKDGKFVRQLKPRVGEAVTFANLQDIYVDEIGGRIFILDDNNLYLGKIPTDKSAPAAAPPASDSPPAAENPPAAN